MKSVNQFNLKLGKTGSFSKPKTANVKDHSEVAIDLVTVLDITIEKKTHAHNPQIFFFFFLYYCTTIYSKLLYSLFRTSKNENDYFLKVCSTEILK